MLKYTYIYTDIQISPVNKAWNILLLSPAAG